MFKSFIIILSIGPCVTILAAQEPPSQPRDDPARVFVQIHETKILSRIAFGSCHDQNIPKLGLPLLPKTNDIWDVICSAKPQMFVFLGDNIYAKTTDVAVMRTEYAKLEADEGFKRFRGKVPMMATWDDNDYGYSDVGAENPIKSQSQALFLEFFGVPRLSPRWSRDGIYDAVVYGLPGARVQIILLDTRYFRSPLKKRPKNQQSAPDRPGPYVPTDDPSSTILGPQQWKWLEQQLREPAEVRIIASSIQVISEEHGFEKWANFPLERERLFRLIRVTKAEGVVFISGDRHHAEISRLEGAADYPLYDITSSSLNKPRLFTVEANRHRLGEMYFHSNFGLITIDWERDDPALVFSIHGSDGAPKLQRATPLSALR